MDPLADPFAQVELGPSGFRDPTHPVTEPGVAEGYVNPHGHAAGHEVFENIRTDTEQLLDLAGAEGGEESLPKNTVMGGQRKAAAYGSKAVSQLEEGDIGRLAVRQSTAGRLHVSALHQSNVDAGFDQAFHVPGGSVKVRLDGRSEAVLQASLTRFEHTAEHRISAVVILGSDLNTLARWKSHSDRGEMVCTSPLVDIQAEVGQVHGQPRRVRQRHKLLRQLEILSDNACRHGRVFDQLPELIDAGGHTRARQLAGQIERVGRFRSCDIAVGGTPGPPLAEWRRPYGALPLLARGEAE